MSLWHLMLMINILRPYPGMGLEGPRKTKKSLDYNNRLPIWMQTTYHHKCNRYEGGGSLERECYCSAVS
jgi:hypothetical protein